MSASACRLSVLAGGALLALCACGDPAEYRFGTNLTGLRFAPVDSTEGIYPSTSVLRDPKNPFLHGSSNLTLQPDGGVGTKWALLAQVGGVPTFYAFATALALLPTGENQFYAAQMLQEIVATKAYVAPGDEKRVTAMAIAGYQAVLDAFPGSVSYNADGVTYFRVGVPAYKGIVALGGKPLRWALVTSQNGDEAVVNIGGP
jgi:hypothetical protein